MTGTADCTIPLSHFFQTGKPQVRSAGLFDL